jgi:hypothetical protein
MQKQNSMALKWCKEGFCPYLHPVGAPNGRHPIGGTQLPGVRELWVDLHTLGVSPNPPRFCAPQACRGIEKPCARPDR